MPITNGRKIDHLWAKNRLKDIDAVENEDYEGAKILAPSGQSKKDHIIKFDTAKVGTWKVPLYQSPVLSYRTAAPILQLSISKSLAQNIPECPDLRFNIVTLYFMPKAVKTILGHYTRLKFMFYEIIGDSCRVSTSGYA